MIAVLASMFSGSVLAVGETEDFECPWLAESNNRVNTKAKADEIKPSNETKKSSTVQQ
jgi:hypothetical protein